jgi:hypothetical protein
MDMASLLSQPQTPTPPDADPSQGQRGGSMAGQVQSLMQPGGAPGMPGQPGQQQPLDHATAAAGLRHLAEFSRHWREIMTEPGFGTKDIKGSILEMMAEVMGDGLVTLPQVMDQLKRLPTQPLQQRQWVEQHYKDDQQAQLMLMEQYAKQAGPGGPFALEQAKMQQQRPDPDKHVEAMERLRGHFKAMTPKKRG